MSGINFKFTGTNDDVLKKIHQIQNELSKVYNKTNNTKIDLGKDIDFSLLGENFKRLDQQSRDAFNKMSKEAQQYTKDIQSNILALQQVEKMQSGLNTLYEEGNMDLDSYIQSQARLTVLHDELAKAIQENEANLRAESVAGKIAEDSIAGLHAKVLLLTTYYRLHEPIQSSKGELRRGCTTEKFAGDPNTARQCILVNEQICGRSKNQIRCFGIQCHTNCTRTSGTGIRSTNVFFSDK